MNTLASIISEKCNVQKCRRTINRYVHNEGFTLKKAYRTVNILHNKDKVKDFCLQYKQANSKNALISIDEAGFYVGEHRRKGWSSKGTRLSIQSDKSLRRYKFSLILAISCEGIVDFRILEHNCKKVDFIDFIKNLNVSKESIILMDNIAFHHSKEIRDIASKKQISILYTIPYSPKLNPIENVFGMLKPLYRQICPMSFNPHFDYKKLFESIIQKYLNQSLVKYFMHVQKFVDYTLCNIDQESFIFNGYDIK
jgi:transposase